MTKILAAAILGLAALTQSAAAAPGQTTGQPVISQKVGITQKQGFTRPMVNKHIQIRPVVTVTFKPAVQPRYKPVDYKPIVIQHVMHKPMYRPVYHPIMTTHAGYKPSYHAPKYNYLPYATYGYDSAPKDCTLVVYKSDYGIVRKVWRCVVVEKVEVAPVKIIERTIEKLVIEKRSIEKVPTDDTLPPK
jgi:hypothetical protein